MRLGFIRSLLIAVTLSGVAPKVGHAVGPRFRPFVRLGGGFSFASNNTAFIDWVSGNSAGLNTVLGDPRFGLNVSNRLFSTEFGFGLRHSDAVEFLVDFDYRRIGSTFVSATASNASVSDGTSTGAVVSVKPGTVMESYLFGVQFKPQVYLFEFWKTRFFLNCGLGLGYFGYGSRVFYQGDGTAAGQEWVLSRVDSGSINMIYSGTVGLSYRPIRILDIEATASYLSAASGVLNSSLMIPYVSSVSPTQPYYNVPTTVDANGTYRPLPLDFGGVQFNVNLVFRLPVYSYLRRVQHGEAEDAD